MARNDAYGSHVPGAGQQRTTFDAQRGADTSQNFTRPPTCYNCGQEHHTIACPEATRSIPAGLAAARAGAQFHHNHEGNSNIMQHSNNRRVPSAGPHYPGPKSNPVVTRYSVPGHHNPTDQGSYPSSNSAYPSYQNHDPQYPHQGSQGGYHPYPPAQHYGPPDPSYGQQHDYRPYNGASESHYPQTYQNPNQQYPPDQRYPQQAAAYPSQQAPYGQGYNPASQNAPYHPQRQHWNNGAPVPGPYTTGLQQYGHPQNSTRYHPGYTSPAYQPPPKHYQQGVNHLPDGHQSSFQSPAVPIDHSQPRHGYSSHGPTLTGDSQVPESNSSSRASTPYGRPGSASSTTPKREGQVLESGHAQDQNNAVDGIVLIDTDHEQFNWDFKKIFDKPPTGEQCVALAQPLSTTFDMTPAPLLNPRKNTTTSRHARKDNLKDFVMAIRNTPQWTYLQQDPAFKDLKIDDSRLIYLNEIYELIEARDAPPRKRALHEESGNGDVDAKLVEADEDLATPTAKRQRHDLDGAQSDPDTSMSEQQTLLSNYVPLLERRPSRPSTPCVQTDVDAVWAPEPGEGATPQPAEPIDPTKTLFASLGESESQQAAQASGQTAPPPPPPHTFSKETHYSQARSGSRHDFAHPNSGPYNDSQKQAGFEPGPKRRHPSQRDHYQGRNSINRDHQFFAGGSARDFVPKNAEGSSGIARDNSPPTLTLGEGLEKHRQGYLKPNSGKRPEPQRQPDDEIVRKIKRSQPIVAEAYSRRW